MGFGSVLKSLLSEKNMSIKDLSEVTGIPLNTLYSITKRDSVNVRPETLEKIANALQITSDELIQTLRQEINNTHRELELLQYRLYEAEQLNQREAALRKRLSQCLSELTHYSYSDEEIGIIIATAILLKEPPTTE